MRLEFRWDSVLDELHIGSFHVSVKQSRVYGHYSVGLLTFGSECKGLEPGDLWMVDVVGDK